MTLPRHVAIVMDGNGRWARKRLLPRAAGHKAGIKPVRLCIEQCAQRGIEALTLFAFSSENWSRPDEEVSSLMSLFLSALEREVADLDRNQVRLRFIGDVSSLSAPLQERMAELALSDAEEAHVRAQFDKALSGVQTPVDLADFVSSSSIGGQLKLRAVPSADARPPRRQRGSNANRGSASARHSSSRPRLESRRWPSSWSCSAWTRYVHCR